MTPPLLVLDVSSDGIFGKCLFDPGSNISAISLKMLKKTKNIYIPLEKVFNTMSGEDRLIGITIINLKILDITKRVVIYVLNSNFCKFDYILGLDLIPSFNLSLNDSLTILQNVNVKPKPASITLSTISTNSSKNFQINWNESIPVELFETKVSHLDSEKRSIIKNFIEKHSSLFAKDAFDIGSVKNYKAHISLSSDSYVSKKPYRCTFDDQTEIERQVAELLRHNIIRESSSPFASPVTMQYKKTGLGNIKEKTRMCVDYRALNKLVIPENHPFPLIEDIITKTRGCSWFSAIDINSAFWSIPICAEDRLKTGFITQNGMYEWCYLPYGLKTAPATFQRVLSSIIRRHHLSSFCINYLDDILIFSKSFEEHMSHLEALFNTIKEEGFRLKFVKCNFASKSIQYLGHVLGPDSVEPLQDNLAAINDFPTPKSRKNIRQFLGKINFYRKFIPQSATLLEPFHNLLRKDVPFHWSSDCQESFSKVKHLLTSSPILTIFDRTKPIFIYTDASGVGIGAVLKQKQADGLEKPVAYFSRKLSEAQQKKKAIYIESLAIREAIRYWRFWLIGRKFTVITDHKPLEHLNIKARTDEELGDLANELLQFDFEILYRPGSFNSEADCLSRNPVLNTIPDDFHEPIIPSLNFLTLDEIRNSQKSIIRLDSDIVKSNVIFRNIKGKKCIVIDKSFGEHLTKLVHHRFGHIGPKHIMLIIRKYFYFNNMTAIVRKLCSSCSTCICNKTRRPKRSGKLGFLGPASSPYEIMSLDTIGGFGGNRSPKRYLHLLVDHFSRYAFILCTKGQSAREMIQLVNSVQRRHPIGTLLTDQYGGLSSDEFQSYCSNSGICHVFIAVDSAFSNGLNERVNQTLVNRIRCMKNDKSAPSNRAWSSIASECVSQYNDSPHSVTTFPPSYLLNGCSKNIVPDILIDPPNLDIDRKLALHNTIRSHNYNKSRYDKNKSDVLFSVGDSVYADNGNKLNRDKLDKVRVGPFLITRKLCETVFEVDIGYGAFSKRLYHVSKLLKV